MLRKLKFFLSNVKNINILIIISLIILHFPFLNCDPDADVEKHSRGAWTDEGLYSSQSLNFINTGKLKIKENITFIKNPLYTLVQIPIYFIFEQHLVVGRITVLLILIIVLYFLMKHRSTKFFARFLVPMGLLFYPIFMFSHYAMSEVICISFIMLSLLFIVKFYENGKNKYLFLATLTIFITYSFKIQFLYAIAIIPLTILIVDFKGLFLFIFKNSYKREQLLQKWGRLGLCLLYSFVLTIIYVLFWYLPNYEFYNFVMRHEVFERYPPLNLQHLINSTIFNLKNIYVYVDSVKPFFWLTLFSIPFFFLPIFKKNNTIVVIIAFSISWLCVELHKFPMSYLPTRYLLSTFMSLSFLISAVYAEMWTYKKLKYVSITFTTLILLINLNYYLRSYNNRTYDIKFLNEYMSKHVNNDNIIIGAWATTATWNTKAITFPVWNDFLNYENPIEKYKPTIIISELDESDSDHAYSSQKINLLEVSDSVRYFSIWRYDVGVFWIRY